MSEAVGEAATAAPEPDAFAWRLQKMVGSNSADITLGEMYADLSGPELTVIMRTIGEGLIKLGTQLIQSRVGGGDEWSDEEDEGW